MTTFLFYIAAICSIACAFGVIISRNPLRAALLLIASLTSIAVLYIILDAGFVAAMQILVYAGAIVVLFIFVIMLLNLQPGANRRTMRVSIAKVLGGAAMTYIVVALLRSTGVGDAVAAKAIVINGTTGFGTVLEMGRVLLSRYLFAFEAMSVLLLVAIVGAVTLGLRRLA